MAELDVLSRGDATGGEWLNALRAFSDKYGGASSFDWDRQVKHVAVANVWSQLQKQTTTSGEDPLLSLTVVKILMRGRDSIDVFLSVEAFELFIRVAEQATDEAAACEAIKCAINSVYKRPSFVADLLATQTTYDTLFHLTSLARPFAWHTLVWKCLLATFEHPAAIERVEHTLHGYACILPVVLTPHHEIYYLFNIGILYILSLQYWRSLRQRPPYFDGELRSGMYVDIGFLRAMSALVTPRRRSCRPRHRAAQGAVRICLCLAECHVPATGHRIDSRPRHGFAEQCVGPAQLAVAPRAQIARCKCPLAGAAPGAGRSLHMLRRRRPYDCAVGIMKVRVEHTQDPGVVVPVVIGLHQLAKNSVKGLSLLQQAIFQINNHTSAEIAQTTPLSELPMSPPPLVKGCLQQTLCTFMTSTNTDLKRCVSEFLFTLCRHNALEFTQRTGLGNAVALLRLKGIM
ncbi:hypothetical protein H257_12446 [Aphanomyces astaci]|uniref:Uncharacterized protein n=1 Tax=Aphanomyces astaci TaxID=112090 RepID=W4FZ22_APHAT|nr:hypothetical protein H257_12446 [Aphanomyces astaci]ETV72717.1 hypothetical protein H257_12446 [Aphanomyces astaci]|eukprot:XP_009837949.1 hypothetical protein H257_12446 [Aphanomyces astaci]